MISVLMSLAIAIGAGGDRPPMHVIGKATWYDASRNYAWYTHGGGRAKYHQEGAPYKYYGAAGPKLRALKPFDWGDRPYPVFIRSFLTGKVITVWVVDTCACIGGGIIDLAPAVWKKLGVPLGRGIMKIEMTIP